MGTARNWKTTIWFGDLTEHFVDRFENNAHGRKHSFAFAQWHYKSYAEHHLVQTHVWNFEAREEFSRIETSEHGPHWNNHITSADNRDKQIRS